jgi:hypothetical protein
MTTDGARQEMMLKEQPAVAAIMAAGLLLLSTSVTFQQTATAQYRQA